MEYDNYIIEKEGQKVKIYPLLEITKSDILYLIYTTDTKNIYDNIYVGEVKDNKVIPIKEELISSFDKYINKLLTSIK